MKRSLRERARAILLAPASRGEIAFGLAVGVFVSFSPFFGAQMLICLALVLIFKRLNKPAVFAGVQLSWFYPLMLYIDYVAGCLLVPGARESLVLDDFSLKSIPQVWRLVMALFPVLLAGSLLAGTVAAAAVFAAAMILMGRYRDNASAVKGGR